MKWTTRWPRGWVVKWTGKDKKGDASSIGGFEGYGDEADADSAETQFSRHCPHFSGPSSSSLMINNN